MILCVDTETTGLCPYKDELLTVQVYNPLSDGYTLVYGDEKQKLKSLQPLFDSSLCILHNAKFDFKFLKRNGLFLKNVWDTQINEMLINGGKREGISLQDITEKYLGITLDKTQRKRITASVVREPWFQEYAKKDVIYLHKIYELQKKRIEELELSFLSEVENKLTLVLGQMELNGILLDIESMPRQTIEEKIKSVESDILDIIWNDERFKKYWVLEHTLFSTERKLLLNLSSPKQRKEFLSTIIPNIPDTSISTLKDLKDKYKIVELLIEYNKYFKLKSSFIETLPNHINSITGRIHTDFFQILNTGRIASRNPNLQQIPARGEFGKVMRSCFTPSPGYVFVGGDYANMELRILAELSKSEVWIDAFNNDRDLHGELAAKTFKIPIEKVRTPFPQNPSLTYRDVQKAINFGIAYGAGPSRIASLCNIPLDEAKDIVRNFINSSGIKGYLKTVSSYGLKYKKIRTPKPFRRLRYLNDEDYRIEKQAKNTPIQGCNADIMKYVLVKVQEYIDENNYPARLLLQVYDEILTEVKEDRAEEWKSIVEQIMTESAQLVLKNVKAKADLYISDKWKK